MTTAPMVSVIIPAYNDQAGLDYCLDGLKNQTFPCTDFEIIIVDNGSTPALHTKHHPDLKTVLIVCHTKGSYAARNAGITVARGEILALLDADCKPIAEWLTQGVEALNNAPSKAIIGGDIHFSPSSNPNTTELYQLLTGFGQQENISTSHFAATANILVSRKSIEEIGFFDERLLSGGDREWSWRAQQHGFQIIYCPTVLVHTHPRTTLQGAIKQTRRVAGGRYRIKQLRLMESMESLNCLSPRRSVWEATHWLLTQPQLSLFQRIKLLGLASLLKLTHTVETLRLRLGTMPERC